MLVFQTTFGAAKKGSILIDNIDPGLMALVLKAVKGDTLDTLSKNDTLKALNSVRTLEKLLESSLDKGGFLVPKRKEADPGFEIPSKKETDPGFSIPTKGRDTDTGFNRTPKNIDPGIEIRDPIPLNPNFDRGIAPAGKAKSPILDPGMSPGFNPNQEFAPKKGKNRP